MLARIPGDLKRPKARLLLMVLLAAPEIKAQIGEIFAKLAPMRQPRLRLIEALV